MDEQASVSRESASNTRSEFHMTEESSPSTTKPRSRIALLIGLGFVLAVAAIFWFSRGRNDPVTRRRLDAARQKWLQNEPKSYDLEVVVSGKQGATYEVHVRGGEVSEAFRNQAPLKQQRTFRTWSGPGMFDTIESDVDTLEFAVEHPNDPRRMMLTLKARFDEKTGLPMTYLRSEWGTNHDVAWKVTRFELK